MILALDELMSHMNKLTMISVVCVVDFMCPWSYIGLQSLYLALQQQSMSQVPVRIAQLLPFEFDSPGTYPAAGTDWTDYCQGYGPIKAKFLLEEKLPRAFALGRDLGIRFDIKRRIVHTTTVNAALMLVQEGGQDGDGSAASNRALEFSLAVLREHFENLRNPNDSQVLTPILERLGVESEKIKSLFRHENHHELERRNEAWTQQGRDLGAPPLPLFIVTCGDDEENMCLNIFDEGPTRSSYFTKLFGLCEEKEKRKVSNNNHNEL